MSDHVTIQLHVSTGYVGADYHDEIQMHRPHWEAMTPKEQEEYCQEELKSLIENHIESWWEVTD
ncbi:hypothetical protein OG393_29375 [Streptomyces sp. NBC_01216]|uniref:DUF7167 family protein n=1 Tax=Streptomyces sp. NBC_01216 TaxID=2903778 RepID=UPI002E101992|nr:hypothetical protein OG393_29375 [Streptomyces sp. NBC_01216]